MTESEQSRERVLAVFAHPDDETLGAGALLALAARAGFDVSVVTCTRGERGEVIPADLAHLRGEPEALAEQREAELSEALAALGVHRNLFLDQVPGLPHQRPDRFVDSGMAWVRPGLAGPAPDAGPHAFSTLDVDVLATLLAVVIRHLRPTTVLTEEPGGGYGHPDHVQAHRATMRAVELAAAPATGRGDDDDPLAGLEPWTVPTVAWVAQSEPDMRAAAEALVALAAREGAPRGADGIPLELPEGLPAEGAGLPSLFVPAHEIDVALDARPVVPAVLAAMRAHRSQVQAVQALGPDGRLAGRFAVSNGMLQPLLDRAYLRLAPGYGPPPAAWAALAGASGRAGSSPLRELLHDHEGGGGRAGKGAAEHAANGVGPADGAAPLRELLQDHERSGGPAGGGARGVGPAGGGARGGAAAAGDAGAPGGGDPSWPYLVAVALLAGGVVGVLGTVVHRWSWESLPVGMAVALGAVLAAATTARALARAAGLLAATIAIVVVAQVMTFVRPGGDILVTGEALSYVWLFGAPLVCLAAAFLPRRWFADTPAPRADHPGGAGHG